MLNKLFEENVYSMNGEATQAMPPIYLDFIFKILQFEISSLMNLIYSLFQTWILEAKAGRNIQFKLGKKASSSNWIFQTWELQKSSADR